jgi:hypothetical protein
MGLCKEDAKAKHENSNEIDALKREGGKEGGGGKCERRETLRPPAEWRGNVDPRT